MTANLTPEVRESISAALVAGNKIEAIKLYREATGLGLAEAKTAVENFDHQWDSCSSRSKELPGGSTALTPEQVEAISDALARRRKIEAIKIYRQVTGKGLKESKDFIDALIPQLKQQDPVRFAHADEGVSAGCGVKVVMILLVTGLAIWVVQLLA